MGRRWFPQTIRAVAVTPNQSFEADGYAAAQFQR
jgi:hypothetical protein